MAKPLHIHCSGSGGDETSNSDFYDRFQDSSVFLMSYADKGTPTPEVLEKYKNKMPLMLKGSENQIWIFGLDSNGKAQVNSIKVMPGTVFEQELKNLTFNETPQCSSVPIIRGELTSQKWHVEESVLRLAGVGTVYAPEKNSLYMDPKTGESKMSKNLFAKIPQHLLGLAVGWGLAAGEHNNTLLVMHQLLKKQEAGTLPDEILLTGHSRGAVQTLVLAKLIYLMFPNIKVDIMTTDPVAGPLSDLDPDKRTIPPNVRSFVSMYAQDEKFLKPQSFKDLIFDPDKTTVTSFSMPGDHGLQEQSQAVQSVMQGYWDSKRTETEWDCPYVYIDQEITEKNQDSIKGKMATRAMMNGVTSPLVVKDNKGAVYIFYSNPPGEDIFVKTDLPQLYKEMQNKNTINFSSIPLSGEIFKDIQNKTQWTSKKSLEFTVPQQSIDKMHGQGLRKNNQFVKTSSTKNLPPELQKFHEELRGAVFTDKPTEQPSDPVWDAKKKSLPTRTPEDREAYLKVFYNHNLQRQATQDLKNDSRYREWYKKISKDPAPIKKINDEIDTAIKEIGFLMIRVSGESEKQILSDVRENLKALKIPETEKVDGTIYKTFYMQMRSVNKEIVVMARTLSKESPVTAVFNKLQKSMNNLFNRLFFPTANLHKIDEIKNMKKPLPKIPDMKQIVGKVTQKVEQKTQQSISKKQPWTLGKMDKEKTQERHEKAKSLPQIPQSSAKEKKPLPQIPQPPFNKDGLNKHAGQEQQSEQKKKLVGVKKWTPPSQQPH